MVLDDIACYYWIKSRSSVLFFKSLFIFVFIVLERRLVKYVLFKRKVYVMKSIFLLLILRFY